MNGARFSQLMFVAGILALCAAGPAGSAPACKTSTFARAPSADDLVAAYPTKARTDGLSGRAVLRCAVRPDGVLADCAVDSEDPADAGFGAAALGLASKIQMTPPCAGAPETQPGGARIPVRFELPKEPPTRTPIFRSPPKDLQWLAPLGPFWPEDAVRRGLGGSAAIDCQVDPTSHLTHCKVSEELPARSGFGDALLKMAKEGWITAAPVTPSAAVPSDGIWRFGVVLAPHRF